MAHSLEKETVVQANSIALVGRKQPSKFLFKSDEFRFCSV